MALIARTRLGPYEILSPIGKGGMGEVYKARDTRLDRTVAIKVLPEHLAESPERKARFEREAKAISPPRFVLDGPYWLDPTGHVAFGVFPGGKLLMIDTGQANEIHVVLNWFEELKHLVDSAAR